MEKGSSVCNRKADKADLKKVWLRDAWVAQLAKCPISAQGMISQFMGSSPMSGSVLTTQSLEPASDSDNVCVSFSLCPSPAHALSVSLSLCLSLSLSLKI